MFDRHNASSTGQGMSLASVDFDHSELRKHATRRRVWEMGMRTIQLTDNTLLGYARDRRIRSALPIFERLYRSIGKPRGCRCRKRQGSLGATLAAVKQSVACDPGLARQLKNLTGANVLVVHVRKGNRIVRKDV